LELMLRAYELCYKSRKWHESAAARLGLDPSAVDRYARVALAFHDAGKIFFQDSIRRCKGSRWHEVLSGLLLSHSMPEFGYGSLDGARASVHVAILYHHTAMRRPQELLGAPVTSLVKALGSQALDGAKLGEAKKAIELVVGEEVGLDETVADAVRRSFKQELSLYLKAVESAVERDQRAKVLASRLLSILIVTDNLSAAETAPRAFLADLPPYCNPRRSGAALGCLK